MIESIQYTKTDVSVIYLDVRNHALLLQECREMQ